MLVHPINPVYDGNSKILILGSFPSVKSREKQFFYGHPQNRFWRVLSRLLGLESDASVEEKRLFLLENRIALWDVIASCEIEGSADSRIKNASANDISVILKAADISAIFVNGKTAKKYYDKYIKDKIRRDSICLPSTSAANAAYSLERLVGEWEIILPFIKQADR